MMTNATKSVGGRWCSRAALQRHPSTTKTTSSVSVAILASYMMMMMIMMNIHMHDK